MAVGGDSYTELRDILACGVCLNDFDGRDPRVLPCAHPLCFDCIKCLLQVAKTKQPLTDVIMCPMCQAQVTVRGITSMPKFFIGTQIKDFLKNSGPNYTICKICQSKTHRIEVSVYCFDCASAFCSSCNIKHEENGRYDKHRKVTVTASTIHYLFCKTHEKHIEALCLDCNFCVCSHCIMGIHHQHQVRDLSVTTEQTTYPLEGLINEMEVEIQKSLMKFEQTKKKFNVDLDSISKELDEHHRKTIEVQNKQYKFMCERLQWQRKSFNDKIEQSVVQLTDAAHEISGLRHQILRLRKPISQFPQLSTQNLTKLVADMDKCIPEVHLCLDEPPKIEFKPKTLGNFAEIQIHVNTNLAPPKLLWKTSTKYIWGMEFFPDGDLLVATTVLNVHDRATGSLKQHDVSELCRGQIIDVTLSPRKDKIALICPGRLHILTQPGGKWKTRSEDIQDNPTCVVITSSGTIIVSDDEGLIRRYDEREDHFKYRVTPIPSYMATTNKGEIFVSYTDEGFLNIFKDFFQDVREVPPETEGMSLQPRGLCVDSKGNIFVADGSCNCVILFDSEGRFVREVVRCESDIRLVAIHNDKYLAVASERKRWHYCGMYLELYELQ